MHQLSWTVEMFHSPKVLLIIFEVFWMGFNTFRFLSIFTKFHDHGPVAKSTNWCVYKKSYAPAMHHLSCTVEMFHPPWVLLILFEVFWMSSNPICFLRIFTKFHDPGPVAKSRNWCVYNNSYAPAMHHLSWTVEMFHSPRVLLIIFEVFWISFNTFCFLTIFTKFHDPGPVAKSRN